MSAGHRGTIRASSFRMLSLLLLCGSVAAQWSFGARDGTVGSAISSLTTVDLNGDAYPDVVVTDPGARDAPGGVRLLLNQVGVLTPFATLSAGVAPIETRVADVDLDGGADLVILEGRESTQVLIRHGRGLGVFTAPTSLGVLKTDFDDCLQS